MEINISRITKGILNTVSGVENKDRLAICNSCEYKVTDIVNRCGVCHCKLDWKSNSPEESCPKNQWIDIKRTQYPAGIAIKSKIVEIEGIENGDVRFKIMGDELMIINEFKSIVAISFSEVKGINNLPKTVLLNHLNTLKINIQGCKGMAKVDIKLLNPNNTQIAEVDKFTIEC
jgi:hypothetical protein